MTSNRRQFMQTIAAGASGIAIPATATSAGWSQTPGEVAAESDKQVLLVGDKIAVANTEYGKVRGYMLRGINYFLGIPYGADTSGSNRFMPPQTPKPWSNVYPALWWGNVAPQPMENKYADKFNSFRDRWNHSHINDACPRI